MKKLRHNRFDDRIRELVNDIAELLEIMEPLLLSARQKLHDSFTVLYSKLLTIVLEDRACNG
ncbi:hypothetical protein CEV31_0028 [Brucella thiophenivorans]|uniref:Transposase n=1 Tax=Brucella thiophenivorans TaxID=571255 RepID=A0A256G8B2_9HYPH|nr:hypothetical protein CEV31_0028 [Brucella thiophenivorans]